MPRRPYATTPVNAGGTIDPAGLSDVVEHLRMGTREQYESDWTLIPASGSHAFDHSLAEVPWHVDVIRSLVSDGARSESATAEVTVAKTDSAITVTNGASTAYYFRVRAL